MTTTFSADFPEHRKKKIVEKIDLQELVKFLHDYDNFALPPKAADDNHIYDRAFEFLTLNSERLTAELQSISALVEMANKAREMIGLAQEQVPVNKSRVGPAAPIIATPIVEDRIEEDNDDPLLAELAAQEMEGSTLDAPKEETKIHRDKKETLTAQGTRLALP
jgi:hypothetical protein